MGLGILVGFILEPAVGWVEPQLANTIVDLLVFPSKLFLALIQMIVIPLVFASIIRGLAASENLDQLRKMGLRVVLFFVITTTISI